MLADAVIPNEYGIDPRGKLRIGSMICSQLLGKLLADLASMREESMATAGLQVRSIAHSCALFCSFVCSFLHVDALLGSIGQLLADLAFMQEESMASTELQVGARKFSCMGDFQSVSHDFE